MAVSELGIHQRTESEDAYYPSRSLYSGGIEIEVKTKRTTRKSILNNLKKYVVL